MNYYQPLLPGERYHIVSRATGNEQLFTEQENYRFFLERFGKYILPVADVYAYALLPNHFHFLIAVHPYDTLVEYYNQKNKPAAETDYPTLLPRWVMQQFSNLLNSYTKSFNKRYNRKGSLFMDYLRRIPVTTTEQLLSTVFYIHKNPVHHGYAKRMEDWQWSSYKSILSDAATQINRQQLLNEFETKEQFIRYHNQPVYLKNAVVVE